MNLYFVKSKEALLYEAPSGPDGKLDPDEWEHMVGLVLANTRSQARYLLWQADWQLSRGAGPSEMPNMITKKLGGGFDGEPRVVSGPGVKDDEEWRVWWDKT
jgi:hypothetical protein